MRQKNTFYLVGVSQYQNFSGKDDDTLQWFVFLHYSTKFNNNGFFFVGLTNVGTFIVLWLVGSLSLCIKFPTTKYNQQKG